MAPQAYTITERIDYVQFYLAKCIVLSVCLIIYIHFLGCVYFAILSNRPLINNTEL